MSYDFLAKQEDSASPKKSVDVVRVEVADLCKEVAERIEQGARFAGLVGEIADGESLLHALLAHDLRLPHTSGTYTMLTANLSGAPPSYPSLVGITPAAAVFEREVFEHFGFFAEGHETSPLLLAESLSASAPRAPFVPQVDAPGAFQLSVGPVRSGVTEAQQFVFETVGEEMLHLTVQLYYKHRGVEKACAGRTPEAALPLVERISGRSSFAHGLAFCQAVERIDALEPPPRAHYLRTLYAELERLYSHFHDLSDLCENTSLHVMNAQWAWLKEQVLRLNTALGVSRYLRDINAVGGVRHDLTRVDCRMLRDSLKRLARQYEDGERLTNATYSHVQRLEATGVLSNQAVRDYACVGPVARACGLEVDTRRSHPYAAYGRLEWRVAGYTGGDALARMLVRLEEIGQSLRIIASCVDWLEAHPGEIVAHASGVSAGIGLGWSETPRGEAIHFVRLDGEGRIARVKFRTPSIINWQPFSLTIEGIMMPDFAVNKASWNLSVAGNDL